MDIDPAVKDLVEAKEKILSAIKTLEGDGYPVADLTGLYFVVTGITGTVDNIVKWKSEKSASVMLSRP